MELRINSIDYSVPNPIVKAEWIFEEGEQDVTIVFDDLQTELLESIDCYDKVYCAIGYDNEGNKFSASAVYSCDELQSLEDIELEEFAFEKSMRAEYEAKRERYIKDFNQKRELKGLNHLDI